MNPIETSPSSVEEGNDPIKELYGLFDFTRPPFEIPKEVWRRTPEYDEIDEKPLWIIEKALFQFDIKRFTLPELPEGHPLLESKAALIHAQEALVQSMEKVWDGSSSRVVLQLRRAARAATQGALEGIPDGDVAPSSGKPKTLEEQKSDMSNHFIKKKLYFQNLRCFFELVRAYKQEENSEQFKFRSEVSSDIIDWAEVIQLGHITYALVRSAIHSSKDVSTGKRDKRKRKDGRLTMQHIYSVSVDVINGYREELNECQDPNQRRKIFQDMKKAVVIAICHDYKEDYPLLASFLQEKLNELLTWDTAILVRLGKKGYTGTEKRPNIMYRGTNGDEIMQGIDALTKTDSETRDYLIPQIGTIASIPLREIVLRVKAADRLNNLKTLNHQSMQTRKRTVLETPQIVELIEEIEDSEELRPMQRTILKKRKLTLIRSNIEETDKLLEIQDEEIESARAELLAMRADLAQKLAA